MNETFKDFVKYSESHPEMKFWEALLEWSKIRHDSAFSSILVEKNGKLYNTINWTGEDNPMILFGNEVKK